MNDFPTLLYTSTDEIPALLYTWGLKKVPISDGASPYRLLYRVTPGANPKSRRAWKYILHQKLFFFPILLCLVLKKSLVTKISLHPIRDLNLIERKKWTTVPFPAPYLGSRDMIINFNFKLCLLENFLSSREPSMQDLIKNLIKDILS